MPPTAFLYQLRDNLVLMTFARTAPHCLLLITTCFFTPQKGMMIFENSKERLPNWLPASSDHSEFNSGGLSRSHFCALLQNTAIPFFLLCRSIYCSKTEFWCIVRLVHWTPCTVTSGQILQRSLSADTALEPGDQLDKVNCANSGFSFKNFGAERSLARREI